jgi:hypothetical protein
VVSRSSIELANKRGEQLRREFPRVVSARYDRASGKVVVELSSKLTLSFSPQDAQGPENAKPGQLEEIELSPSGYGSCGGGLGSWVRWTVTIQKPPAFADGLNLACFVSRGRTNASVPTLA